MRALVRATSSPAARGSRVELLRARRRRARLAALAGARRARRGLPLVAAGDVHMHVRARRALQDTLTAIRLRTPLAECGYALLPNGERHLRSRARLATLYPRELLDETLAIAERCTFSLDELRYEYPEELVPPGETPASHLRELTEAGLARRYGRRRRARRSARADRARARADRRAAATSPTSSPSTTSSRSRARKDILCQGRGSAANSAVCYAWASPRSIPSRMTMLFERFIRRSATSRPTSTSTSSTSGARR